MKKNFIAAAIIATAALSMSNAFASAGVVNFNGEILDAACTVDVGSQNQTVDLGKYNRSEFTNAGDVTAATQFNIVLKDCPSTVSSASVRFDGTPDASDSSLLAIDSSVAGAATGVAINLMTADKAHLPLHGSNGYSYPLSSTQDNTLNFYAQYKSTATAVTAGPANSVANFSVVYN
ncbi:TPA: fimbrial protein [Enterobacter asburiae]|uniref:fimbrial protein n=1 Tax=Enterobacter asburiae TaxID=61645 RepID=UPI0003A43393|nr:fimbrial protein [Enterobacter asburiae]SAH18841.1 P pilus assembly protein%2C pilin FimA [Enterobacter cloacae]MDL4614295.1 fimbrial protein [Enterobacter asburiae]HCM9129857.1 fimbrial protein [Enterobacter asburiae]HDW1997284.1 fimbrial protein [Enterobacter asburiae]HED1593079.1 fimbrial protein [Enterobacter asburiae]